MGTAALAREVQALRCGLDADAWTGAHCAELTDQSYTEADRRNGKPLPFDHQRAHRLYKALFGEVEDLIQGKHLLLVAPGPLAQLPFHVLVTAPPASGDHRSAAWLARTNALTTLPAVSSLKALRRIARPGTATKPLIAFGNPLLDGNQADPKAGAYYKELAAAARARQSCAAAPLQQVAALTGRGGSVPPMAVRGGLAQVSMIRQQAPLPETAGEICAVARSLKADAADIRLGAEATETQVKRLSASGNLAKYSVVHFATHGALAGEVNGASEPGLLLTPPASATADDDGYLSASEIAALKLDANWVILSACNTAGGEAQNSQALSGLTRAFIYAQARALLVSHWAVDSGATVKLVTTAIGEMAGGRSTGRAEALRRAMLAVIDKGAPHEAHPAYWAPFIVVGEGGR
jgi:CHAT domain-containing protein